MSQIRAASEPIPSGGHNFPYNTLYRGHPTCSLPIYPIPQHQASTVGFPFYQRVPGTSQYPSHPFYQHHHAMGAQPSNPYMQSHYFPQNYPLVHGVPLTYYQIPSVSHQNVKFTPTNKHIPRDKVEEGITHIGLLVLIHMRVLTYKLDPTH